MKIIYVTVEDRFFISQRLNLAIAARDKGHDVVVASRGGELKEEIENFGFKYIDTRNSRSGKKIIQQFAQIKRLHKIFIDEKPDVVHNISIKPVIYGSIAARFAGTEKIVNLINGLGYVFISTLSVRILFMRTVILCLYWLALRSKNINVIFQNSDDLNFFTKLKIIKESQCHLILGSGVDIEKFKPLSNTQPRVAIPKILYCGRMLWSKGLQHLIDASESLKAKGFQFELHIVGEPDDDNPESINLSTIKGWQEKKLIVYHGYQKNVVKFIHECSFAVLPTYYREGVPLSLIEIASCGKPIITTAMPGCREIVKDNLNGILVKPKDTQQLENAMEYLLKNPKLRALMGRKGRQLVVQKFSSDIITSQTLAVYD